MKPGRPKDEDLAALRERIESLYLGGLGVAGIVRALAAPENATPIQITDRAVRGHLAWCRRKWAKEAGAESREDHRAEMVAAARDRERQAARLAARYSDSNLGVGYLNVALKAQERRARLLGLDFTRHEVTGKDGAPIAVEPAWAEGLPLEERLRRAKLAAEELEMRVAAEEGL